MNGYLWAALGAVVGLLIPLLYLRWREGMAKESAHIVNGPGKTAPRTTSPPPDANRRPPRGYHGVSLKPGPQACDAVQAILDQRYLSSEAPALPLQGCDQEHCKCKYEHYRDRRDEEDRRTGWGTFGGFAPSIAEGNRRDKGSDRRR